MHGAPFVQRFHVCSASKLASARLTGLGPLCVPCQPTHVCWSTGDCCLIRGNATLVSGALLPQPIPTVAEYEEKDGLLGMVTALVWPSKLGLTMRASAPFSCTVQSSWSGLPRSPFFVRSHVMCKRFL